MTISAADLAWLGHPGMRRRSTGFAPMLALAVLWFIASGCVAAKPAADKGDAGATPAAAPGKGIQCGKDPVSGVTLCSGTTACPDAVLDSKEFSGCGYRTVVPSFDLECVCNGNELCPIGVAATCDDVATLLGRRTLADICNQAGTGACKEVAASPGGGAGGNAASSCDRICLSECAGSPLCAQSCGC